jgi:glycosyltransferase involved in cell wall biosynthesis
MRILLSAYACEPGKGSEPGVGWRWTCGLAGRVDLTICTRANNRQAIEAELESRPPDDPLHKVRFLYHELPRVFLRLKRTPLLPTMFYYILWQWTLARALRKEAAQVDVIHHLTFCTPLCPGFWPDGKAARVIGPVGAPLVNPHYLPLFGKKQITQRLRSALMRRLLLLPWLRRAFLNAAAVFPANTEAKDLLEAQGVTCQPVMLDTGAPDILSSISNLQSPISSSPPPCLFLYAGVLERRKGLELALRAFSSFIQNSKFNIQNFSSLTLLGTGPDRPRLESLATSLGIAAHVHFPGSVPQAEVARHLAEADVFVFTSVRDTSGGVNLEAMASGLPILCIAHQGVGDITDDTCAIRIPPGPIPETIEALANGMQRLVTDPDLRARLGQNARLRAVSKFSWQEKFDRMVEVYGEVAR